MREWYEHGMHQASMNVGYGRESVSEMLHIEKCSALNGNCSYNVCA